MVLLAHGEYFESENSSLEYQHDADKSNRNFSSGHTEKPTRETHEARKHGKKAARKAISSERVKEALRKYPVSKKFSFEEIHTSKI
jgi:hypothetical protein